MREEVAERLGPGTRLGRYELLRRLAVGGMAEIFLARAAGLEGFEKTVVVKRLLPQLARDEDLVRRFLDEARLAATLVHPNIAQVFDVGRAGDEHFFAMEHVPGRDLHQVMRAAEARGAALPLEQALGIAVGVCAGLHHAHEARDPDGRPLEIVHRDVSPSNVLVSWEGAVKVVDFGIAKAASHRAVTRDGLLKGKLGYMSPEQCTGEPLDRRSDVFSIGILLWEMTTGARLYEGDDLAVLRRIVEVDAPRPSARVPGYPPALEAIVLRALRRDRRERHPSAQDLQIELENFLRDAKLVASPIDLARTMDELFADERRSERAEQATLSRARPGRTWLPAAGAAAMALALACGLAAARSEARARHESPDYQSFDREIRSARRWGATAAAGAVGGAGLLLAGRRRAQRGPA